MDEFAEIMLKPFLACLILTGMHAYLGLHVIKRGIIFVDLALAQTAAFGATAGFALGFGLHSTGNYFCALAFTLLGALLLAFTRRRSGDVPQEAYIGIIYAVAAAASVLVLSRAPEGGEELKSLLVGHLLFVDWDEITKIFVLYLFVSLVHFALRGEFWALSESYSREQASGLQTRVLDFAFYATFDVVVTSSTETAGVLLVFAFLVVPAVCGHLFAGTFRGRLIIAWMTGIAASTGGMLLSYWGDYPTGAAVVCTLGALLAGCLTIRSVIRA